MQELSPTMVHGNILQEFNRSLRADKSPVHLYDFGDGQTNAPMVDPVSGSYLTTSMCYLHLVGGAPLSGKEQLPSKEGGVIDYGNGWIFLPG